MFSKSHTRLALSLLLSVMLFVMRTALGQIFTVGEATATSDIDTKFAATRVELPTIPMSERSRRELIRDFVAEQGFAHRVLPLSVVILNANGNLNPGAEAYKKLIYEKGQAAAVGDRVAVTSIQFKGDRILIDLNGGPYPPHRFLSHIQLGVGGAYSPDPTVNSKPVTGCRITVVFEGRLPEVSAPELKALLYPLIDFGVKSGIQAYADTLPAPIRSAIASHEILVGMDRKMVLAAMGAPESKVRESNQAGERYEEWIYGHQPETVQFVRFVGERVSLIKVAELGKPIRLREQDEMAAYERPRAESVITVGDRDETARKAGVPSMTRPGEVLTDSVGNRPVNGRVQFPAEKQPTDAVGPGAAVPDSSGPGTVAPRSPQ